MLNPKVFCVGELADQGAGHPDFGLYAAKQVQKGQPRDGQMPERGVDLPPLDRRWVAQFFRGIKREYGRGIASTRCGRRNRYIVEAVEGGRARNKAS